MRPRARPPEDGRMKRPSIVPRRAPAVLRTVSELGLRRATGGASIADEHVDRAGFDNAGPSQNNRVIER